MSMDIGVGEEARASVATALRNVMADSYALYVKTHGYHWNVTGPRFSSLHAMFMEQYRELWAALDVLAERIRALGEFAPGSTEEILSPATIRPDNGVPDAETMIANLARGHETLSRVARAALKVAEENGDDVTADLMVQRATVAEKTAWMLRSSL